VHAAPELDSGLLEVDGHAQAGEPGADDAHAYPLGILEQDFRRKTGT
jgi:hypothetical protein